MRPLNSILLISAGLVLNMPLKAQEEYALSDEMQSKIKKLEKQQESVDTQIRKAKKLEDKETLATYENFSMLLKKQFECTQHKEELDIQNCMFIATRDVAKQGNFVAQDSVGITYEHDLNNPEMALRWYLKAYDNPQTPKTYKNELKGNIDKLEQVIPKEQRAKNEESPYSEGMKEEIKFVYELEKEAENNVKKFELLNDSESLVFWKTFGQYVAGMKGCLAQKEEFDIIICFNADMMKLAKQGNFIAQQQLGIAYYEDYHNPKMALKWLNTSLHNPTTTKSFKYKILDDVEKIEGKKSENDADDQKQGIDRKVD